MSKKLAGNKFADSHSTVIDAAYDIAKFAEKNDLVAKISLGIIRSCRAGRPTQNLKIKQIPAGLELVIRGNSYVQTIYLYLRDNGDADKLATALVENFERK